MNLTNRRTKVQEFTCDCIVAVDRDSVNLKGVKFTIDIQNKLFFIEPNSAYIIDEQVHEDTFDFMVDGGGDIIFTAEEIGNHFNSPFLIKEV